MSIDQFLLSADTTDLNYPEIRPTLDLNFARTKTLDPRIDFTRASGGSYVGADGLIKYAGVNEARFDHDPETGESLGLLVEEARTNLFTDSEIKSPETWGGAGSFGFDNIVNPYGVNGPVYYAFQNPDTGVGEKIRTLNANGLTNIAVSFFAKRRIGGLNRDYVRIQFWQEVISGGSLPAYNFKFDGNNPSTTRYQNIKTEKYSNEWYKFSFNPIARTDINNGVFGANARFDIEADNNLGADNYVWGIQVEAGAFPTSYIPTQGSTRTRAADNAQITGRNFSDFFNFNEGTSYVSFKFGANVTDQRPFLNITSSTNLFLLTQRGNAVGGLHALQVAFPKISSSFQISILNTESFISPFLRANSLVSYKSGDISYSTGGRIQFTSNNTFASLNDSSRPAEILNIGNSISRFLNGHISRFTYFPKRLPNAQIQALTR